ncbi:MAG TPA: hypothetical protein VLA72_20170 [Anaerolineales bacterium]|nr:hypothetical protein [Anaerolineales bacterium]
MNKSKLVGGIICLGVAGLLAVANLTMPPENMMFQIGDQNMPWIPVVVLTIIGIVLLATSNQSESETKEEMKKEINIDPDKAALNKRMETMAWGAFLIMLGGQWILRDNVAISNGIWDVGIGLLLLGLNVARYFNGLRMSGFTTFLGILAFVGGLAQMIFGLDFDGALLLIILGAYLILKPWFDKQQLFGKAEQS